MILTILNVLMVFVTLFGIWVTWYAIRLCVLRKPGLKMPALTWLGLVVGWFGILSHWLFYAHVLK